MVGDFGVGKTSLIRRFVEGVFSDSYLSTVGVKITRNTVNLADSKRGKVDIQLLIWDLEGHTKFKAIAPSYLQGSKGALIVADVTRPETIERLIEHVQLFLSVNPQGIIVIALNKTDLADEEKVEKLLQMARFEEIDRVVATYPTSAKNGLNVTDIFEKIASELV